MPPRVRCLPRYQPSPKPSSSSISSTRSERRRVSSSPLLASKSSIGTGSVHSSAMSCGINARMTTRTSPGCKARPFCCRAMAAYHMLIVSALAAGSLGRSARGRRCYLHVREDGFFQRRSGRGDIDYRRREQSVSRKGWTGPGREGDLSFGNWLHDLTGRVKWRAGVAGIAGVCTTLDQTVAPGSSRRGSCRWVSRRIWMCYPTLGSVTVANLKSLAPADEKMSSCSASTSLGRTSLGAEEKEALRRVPHTCRIAGSR